MAPADVVPIDPQREQGLEALIKLMQKGASYQGARALVDLDPTWEELKNNGLTRKQLNTYFQGFGGRRRRHICPNPLRGRHHKRMNHLLRAAKLDHLNQQQQWTYQGHPRRYRLAG